MVSKMKLANQKNISFSKILHTSKFYLPEILFFLQKREILIVNSIEKISFDELDDD